MGKPKRIIKKTSSNTKPRTEKLTPSTLVNGSESYSILEVAKKTFPDNYHKIPLELLGSSKPSHSARQKLRRKKVGRSSSVLPPPAPEPERRNVTVSTPEPSFEDFEPSTGVNWRKSSQSREPFPYTSILEVAKKTFPDNYHKIPLELLGPQKKSYVFNRPIFRRKKGARSSSIVAPPSESQEENRTVLTPQLSGEVPELDNFFLGDDEEEVRTILSEPEPDKPLSPGQLNVDISTPQRSQISTPEPNSPTSTSQVSRLNPPVSTPQPNVTILVPQSTSTIVTPPPNVQSVWTPPLNVPKGLTPQPNDPRVLTPQPIDPRVLTPQPIDPRVLTPQPNVPRVFTRLSNVPSVLESQQTITIGTTHPSADALPHLGNTITEQEDVETKLQEPFHYPDKDHLAYEESNASDTRDLSHVVVTDHSSDHIDVSDYESKIPNPRVFEPNKPEMISSAYSSTEEFSSEDDEPTTVTKGIWDEYGKIESHHILELGETGSIDQIFQSSYFEKLGPTERRLQIEGQKFKVSESTTFRGSLYRAVARAATGSESHFEMTKKDIVSEILSDLDHYYPEIVRIFGGDLDPFQLPSMEKSASNVLKNYKDRVSRMMNGSPAFELWAAGRKYGFHSILIDVNGYDGKAKVINSDRIERMRDPESVNYYFMRTGSLPDSWCYEFLIPIGPAINIEDGVYPFKIFDVILVDRQHDEDMRAKMRRTDKLMPILATKPVCGFGLDHRMFFYKPSHTNDLWSLLSELLNKNLDLAPIIYKMTRKAKINQFEYYHLSKWKKKRLTGQRLSPPISDLFHEASKMVLHRRGNPADLEYAATAFKFSFTLIGMDRQGNFFWKESIRSPSKGGVEPANLSFFVRLMRNRDPYWYALEDAKWSCSKEARIYKNTTFTDDTTCSRQLYQHARPCVTVRKLNPGSGSRWGLVLSHVNTGRRWLAKGLSQITTRTRANVIVDQVSVLSVGLYNRIRRFVTNRTQVHPEASIKQLYLRDHP